MCLGQTEQVALGVEGGEEAVDVFKRVIEVRRDAQVAITAGGDDAGLLQALDEQVDAVRADGDKGSVPSRVGRGGQAKAAAHGADS